MPHLQGHVDMVTEKNSDVQHDFHKDALKLVQKGNWLKVRIRKMSVWALMAVGD